MAKIIVTGSEGLIGNAASAYLEKKGHQVVRVDLKLGNDLRDEKYVREWFAKNQADALVNLFALNDHIDSKHGSSNLFDVTLDSFREYMEVNLTCLFSVCREYARNNNKGTIVNFSSSYGVVAPQPKLYKNGQKHVGYPVSKIGVIQLTRHLAVHLAPNIRVNCIVPGGVEHQQDDEFKKAYGERTPLGRMMKNGEMNGIIEFLCLDESSYATGAVFTIDGGWTAW